MKKVKWLGIIFVFLFLSGCSLPPQGSDSDAASSDISSAGSAKTNISSTTDCKSDTTRQDTINKASEKAFAEEKNQTGTNASEDDKKEVKSEQYIQNNSLIPVVLYYQDSGRNLIPVTRRVEKQEGIARAVINGLIDESVNREEIGYYGVYPILPKGTKVLGIDIKQGIAAVDFNTGILNCRDDISERNIVASIVYSLTEFKSINGAKILIDGRIGGKLKFGTDISGILNRDNVMVNASTVNLTPGFNKVDIYLCTKAADRYEYIVPISVQIEKTGTDRLPAVIAELFAKDYTSRKMYSQIPSGTVLRGSSIEGSVLTLDFSSELRNYGGTAKEACLVNQLMYSMKQIKGVEKIRVLVEGKETILPEGTEISRDLPVQRNINDYIDDYQ